MNGIVNENKSLSSIKIKAFLFDMDGVLFDSMPNHAKAWVYAFEQIGVSFDAYGAYMREGMKGDATINDVFRLELNRTATQEECERIYKIKSNYFDTLGPATPMPYALEVLQTIKNAGLDIYIVTGSGQQSLLNTLNEHFSGFFTRDKMVTAFDVKKGKPDPEPYLMALKKGNLNPDEAIVVENAPLGVKSAVDAGIFTIAVNTGILKDEELIYNGADMLYHSMKDMLAALPEIIKSASCLPEGDF
jgi:HAD superfamily hydrolase (TIGR01509 family)